MITPELKSVMQQTHERRIEDRDCVPASYAHRLLINNIDELGVESEWERDALIAQYSPLAEWLSKPRSVDEFQRDKKDVLNLHGEWESNPYYWSQKLLGEPYDLNWLTGATSERNKLWRENWGESSKCLLSLSSSLKILLPKHFDHLKRERNIISYKQMWTVLEGDKPRESKEVIVHETLDSLTESINKYRKRTYSDPGVGRIGLVIGDFRVGDHSAHGVLFKQSKLAVGNVGKLVVTTPSKRTILATSKKEDAWDDEERLYRLVSNRYIDDVLKLDMPEEYWEKPDIYYSNVWRAIKPDLVFIGEENHPLQKNFELRSRYFGGILLIDDAPITVRSGDLLDIK